MIGILTIALIIICVTLTLYYFRRPRNLPPGPPGWPIIGNLHNVSGNSRFYELMDQYRKQYGDVYCMMLGSHVTVILNGSDVIREAFVEKAEYFSDRPNWLFMVKLVVKNSGLVWSDDWRNVRRLTMRALRDFGVGKASLEQRVAVEAECMCTRLSETNGRPLDPRSSLINAVTNIICSVVFGKRFEYGDPDFDKICDSLNFLIKYNMLISYPNMIPWTSFTMLFGQGLMALKKFRNIQNYIFGRIKEHKETLDPDNIRDFIDLYLLNKNKDSNYYARQKDEDALRIVLDLFFAGTETLASTLQWLILYMMHYPDVQDKCREEIRMVIGDGRQLEKNDMTQLPYTQATILEVQRVVSVGPISLPHMVSKSVEFRGYTLPKGAMVLASLYNTMRDEKAWIHPEEFRPERWIDEKGNIRRNESFMPFSIGKRACLGEQLARLELFIFGGSLLQHFRFKMPDPSSPPSLEPYLGVTMLPVPFEVCISRA